MYRRKSWWYCDRFAHQLSKGTLMDKRLITRHIALMVVFTGVGLTMFTENVRTVQVLGLFACGIVFGVSLAGVIAGLRARKAEG